MLKSGVKHRQPINQSICAIRLSEVVIKQWSSLFGILVYNCLYITLSTIIYCSMTEGLDVSFGIENNGQKNKNR